MQTTTEKPVRRSPSRKSRRTERSGPAFRNIASATWTVTVAVEEARKRGYMSKYDCKHMTEAEYNQYILLCEKEWGVTQWESA